MTSLLYTGKFEVFTIKNTNAFYCFKIPAKLLPNTYIKSVSFGCIYYNNRAIEAYSKFENNVLFWYNESDIWQLNQKNYQYYWVAIG